jgi:hypothetical protein
MEDIEAPKLEEVSATIVEEQFSSSFIETIKGGSFITPEAIFDESHALTEPIRMFMYRTILFKADKWEGTLFIEDVTNRN